MARILLADPSPHAQRMAGQILREEGYSVETVSDGDAAIVRTRAFDPLVLVADAQLPGQTGYDLARWTASEPLVRAVLLSAGARSPVESAAVDGAGARGVVSKPFEASLLLEAIKKQVSWVMAERAKRQVAGGAAALSSADGGELDRERIEAAVTLAFESALPSLIQEVTDRVLIALRK